MIGKRSVTLHLASIERCKIVRTSNKRLDTEVLPFLIKKLVKLKNIKFIQKEIKNDDVFQWENNPI